MSFARSLALAGCLAAVVSGGCYRSADKVENKPASGSAAKSGTGAKSGALPPVVAHGTDIADDRDSKRLQMVTTAQLQEEERKRAEASALSDAAAARHAKPTASSTATPAGTALATATPAALTAPPSAGSAASPSGTGTPNAPKVAVAPSGTSPAAKPSATFDPYIRPATQRDPSQAVVDVRPSRSPMPPQKVGVPPPRTRVLAAPDVAGGTLGITFDSLMFDMKPTDFFSPTLLSDSVKALFDKKVKIRGYIHPVSVAFEKGNKHFILVRDDQGCCFGPGALLYDNIVVSMNPGKTMNFTVKPIAVEGVLKFHEVKTEGAQPTSIFHIDADSAE